MNYIINPNCDTSFISGKGNQISIDKAIFELALKDSHLVIEKIVKDIPVDIFAILGMRNLSSFIGELFAISFAQKSGELFIKNPHQDGYPDFLLMDTIGKEILQKLSSQGELRDKSPFSPFINGGIEVKATCGSVPSPSELRKKGLTKPDMGDTRIKMLKGYDWKAHHRETNNLIGLLWDFDNKIPLIIAIFFSSNLTENDWGKIVTPKEGGGRTTSVSIMPRDGVRKMYNNWILVRDDQRYINFLNKYNKSSLISK